MKRLVVTFSVTFLLAMHVSLAAHALRAVQGLLADTAAAVIAPATDLAQEN